MLWVIVLLLSLQLVVSEEGIRGANMRCSNEGGIVDVSYAGFECYLCICKNGSVQCEKKVCPVVQGCYRRLEKSKDGCCDVCKGCMHKGEEHASDTEWVDPADPCRVFSCNAGVVTESKIECYTPCRNPVGPFPGQCCPTCLGCQINGQLVGGGRQITVAEDPCLKCSCKGQHMTCMKQACPVLHCLKNHIKRIPGECCLHCEGNRELMDPSKGQCMLGEKIFASGRVDHMDRCTRCTCMNGTFVCHRQTCPVLNCPLEHQRIIPPHCCPHCIHSVVEEVRTTCTIGGRSYQDGDTWQLDPCKSCVCHQGQIRCAMETCPNQSTSCPPNYRREHISGECCPRCIENDGFCTVFGDPHYRTYDGKFFSFQGSCKYLLTADCVSHTFSIRVTNDPRTTTASSWTKTVSMKIGEHKVNLGQKMRVKVDGVRIEIPYSVGNILTVNRSEEIIHVYTHLGVRVEWDGSSLLEVFAPTSLKGKLCGLCGNFNNKKQDDFVNRQGRSVPNPQKFGMAWRVGGKKACARPREDSTRETQCLQRVSRNFDRDSRLCSKLKSDYFSECHSLVNPIMYVQSCVIDMCECPNNHCYCDSFHAYVHECKRHGINLLNWRNQSDCKISWNKHRRQRLQ